MGNRKVSLEVGEYYHIYNRGVEKRQIFMDSSDLERFIESMISFNTVDTIGSLYQLSFRKKKMKEYSSQNQPGGETSKLVEFVAYCLNPNHFHFILTPRVDKGIEKFMQKLGTGYTMYFNNRYKRSGVLFQGTFKSVHVESNKQLLHLSAYVNLNVEKHQLGGETSKLVEGKSSWNEYIKNADLDDNNYCQKSIVLNQFKSSSEYKKFARSYMNVFLAQKLHEEMLLGKS